MKDARDAPDGFLSRWSQRKALLRKGEELPAEVAPAPAALPIVEPEPVAAPPAAAAAEDRPPAPTLDEVAQLTPGSDFRRFVAADATPEVRNAALKKLFADPQFNVMDGLDTYIDDYNQFEPLTKANLQLMAGARALGLFDDEAEKLARPGSTNPDADNDPAALTPANENADLQLQPDDAPGQRVAGEGVGRDDGPHDAVPPRGA
jgi:hypothetical protein